MVAVWTKVGLLFSTKRGLIYSSCDLTQSQKWCKSVVDLIKSVHCQSCQCRWLSIKQRFQVFNQNSFKRIKFMSEVINSSMVFNEIKCIFFRDYNWVAAVHICTITFYIWQKQQLVDPKVFLRHPHTENIVWLLPPKLCFIMISIGIDCGIVDICIVIQSVVCLTAVEIVSSCVVVLDHIWVVTGERVAINPEFFNLKISWIS